MRKNEVMGLKKDSWQKPYFFFHKNFKIFFLGNEVIDKIENAILNAMLPR